MEHIKFPLLMDELEKDLISGGLADKKSDNLFDPKQLAIGIQVELEHTDDFEIAKEIAKDHLTEDPYYYNKLKEMESGFSKSSAFKKTKEDDYREIKKVNKSDDLVNLTDEEIISNATHRWE